MKSKIKPITSQRKHINIPVIIKPEHDLDILIQSITSSWQDLAVAMDEWRKFSGNVINKYGGGVLDNQLKIKRTQGSDKIYISEGKGVDNSNHDALKNSFVKASLIDKFANFERAVYSVPALGWTGNNIQVMNIKFGNDEDINIRAFIYDQSISPWRCLNPLENLVWAIKMLDGISINENCNEWLVGNSFIKAKTAEDAFFVKRVLEIAREEKKKRKSLWNKKKVTKITLKTHTNKTSVFDQLQEKMELLS